MSVSNNGRPGRNRSVTAVPATPTRSSAPVPPETNEYVDEHSDGEDGLHEVCNEQPVGADKDRLNCRVFLGKFVVKEWLQDVGSELFLYTGGKVSKCDQKTPKFTVTYNNDGVLVPYTSNDIEKMVETFEFWYQQLNTGIYSQVNACFDIRKLHDRHKVEQEEKVSAKVISAL